MAGQRYTVAVSNYEMVDTLAPSLTSVLEQLDGRFELLVVDDGSEDGSVAVLDELEEEYDRLRVVTDAGNENLGEARNDSFERAEGEYVLSAVDTDDQFTHVIPPFVELYHQIEAARDSPFLLLAGGLYMAPRDLVLEVPYRSLGYGEDRDFYRRLLAEDALVSLSHVPFRHSIGYDRGVLERAKVGVETIVVQFRSGLAFWPYERWALRETLSGGRQLDRRRALAHVLLAPLAYVLAGRKPRYETPEKFRDIGAYKRALRRAHTTISALEERLDFEVDWERVGPRGRALFDRDIVDDVLD